MHELLGTWFGKKSTLMWSIVIGCVLWIANAVFNFGAADYRAFCINILYVVCLITLGGSALRGENNVLQATIGALLMVCIFGNVNVLSEALAESIPSRAIWQMGIGAVLTVALFVNHFLIAHSTYRSNTQIYANQWIIILLVVLRCYQIVLNIASGGFSPIVIEVTVGMLAIIPTLIAVVCVECRQDGYKIQQRA